MGLWRGPTLRSLVEVLDRVIGRGVVIDSDVPVSPALAGLRRAVVARDALELETVSETPASPEATSWGESRPRAASPAAEGEVRDPARPTGGAADRKVRDPVRSDGAPAG